MDGSSGLRAVLALLVIAKGEVVPADRLADSVWSGEAPASTSGALQSYVSHLRKRLEPAATARSRAGVIVSAGPGYAVRLAPDGVDAWRFDQLLQQAEFATPPGAVALLGEALELWRGPAYTDYLWTGEEVQGEALLAQIRTVAPVLLDGVAVMPYVAVDAVQADPVDPMPVHEGAALLSDLPEEAVQALLAAAGPGSQNAQVIFELRQLGGATGRPAAHASAFCHRAAAYSLLTVGVPGTPGMLDHAASVVRALAPWTTGGMLPNFAPAADGAARCYDASTLARLRAAIRTYDPQGVMAIGRALSV